MMTNFFKRPVISILFLLVVPIAGLVLGVGLGFLLGLNGTDAGNFIANLVFLLAVLSIIPLYRFSTDELGLKFNKEKWGLHVAVSLVIFTAYLLFYFYGIRISGLKPVDSRMIFGLVTYLVVVVAEEIYFRGEVYDFVEKRYSAREALVVSSVLFGVFHARQGVTGMVTKTITGLLWGSVRYSTGMIFLLIFPIHFMYNSVWLLFEGNWSNPPAWAPYALPAVEFLIGLAIVLYSRFRKLSI
jgi:membrane protease YdiL (CAAX protease family)